jgi:hypothetical protein
MTPREKLEGALAAADQKEMEAEALLAQTEKIMSELIRARRKASGTEIPDSDNLAITEMVIAELISEGRAQLKETMEESRQQIRQHLRDL